MAVVITSNTILKPCPTSPPHPLTNTLVPLTLFDLAAMDLHVPIMYGFHAPTPSNTELKEGLSRALIHYPHMAGQMARDEQGRPCFLLNNAGVRVIETEVHASLAEKLPLEATTDLSQLHPPAEGVEELVLVQLNRYDCGGIVIGVTTHHRVTDGHSMCPFLVAWAEIVRNPAATPTPAPYLDRAATCIPRNTPLSKFNHLEIEFMQSSAESSPTATPHPSSTTDSSPVNFVARFSADFIASLKARVPGRSSTFECLLAHLWGKITAARGLKEDESTAVRIAVNGRARGRTAVPMQFFGNSVLWAHPRASAGELVRAGHVHAVGVIREAISEIDAEYFKSFVDFGEIMRREGREKELAVAAAPESGSALCPDLEVDSWLGFNFHELDFGSGGPCAFLPPHLPVEGLMVFVPSCREKGGVDVFMALFEEHLEVFKRICYSLTPPYSLKARL